MKHRLRAPLFLAILLTCLFAELPAEGAAHHATGDCASGCCGSSCTTVRQRTVTVRRYRRVR